MSGDIRDLEKLNTRMVESLKRRQGREINQLESAHSNHKAELKKAQEAEVVELQNQNHHSLAKESEKKEKVLSEMKHHLEATQNLTDKQLRDLKEQAANVRAQTQGKLSVERDRLGSEHQLYLDEQNERFMTEVRNSNITGQHQVADINQKMQQQYSQTAAHQSKKLNDLTNEFATRFQYETREQDRLKTETDNRYKKERMATNQRQQIELAKMGDTHQSTVETRDVNFRKGLKDQDLFWDKKYEDNLAKRNEELKRLDNLHTQVLDKMKTDLTTEITRMAVRSDDPFYQLGGLRPVLTNHPEHVEIKVKVPEYAKEDLMLTTNNKEAIVNFNRRFTEASREADGTVNRVNKVESYQTRLRADTALDPKSVKSTYKDGTMTYTIKKA